MTFWKSYPPGWFAFEWGEDEEGGDGDGGGDDGGGGGDDGGGGDGGGDGGGGDGGGGDGGGGDESDGDAGIDNSWQRQAEQQQDDAQRDFERQQDDDRRQREDQDRRREQEEEDRRREEEAERQRQIDEQQRQIEENRRRMEEENRQALDAAGNPVAAGAPIDAAAGIAPAEDPSNQSIRQGFQEYVEQNQRTFNPGDPELREAWLLGQTPTASAGSNGQDIDAYLREQDRLRGIANAADRTAGREFTPAMATSGPAYVPPMTSAGSNGRPVDEYLREQDRLRGIADAADRAAGRQFSPAMATGDSGVSTPPAAPAAPAQVATIAATAAAQATAQAGGTPAQVAAAAEIGARTAADRQTLGQQSAWTQAAFRSQYKADAEAQWARQHNEELQRNRVLYGSSEPRAGTAPLAGAPAGTQAAPDRRIGRTPPPTADQTGRYGINTPRQPGIAAAARAATAAPALPGVAPVVPAAPGAAPAAPTAPAAPAAPQTAGPTTGPTPSVRGDDYPTRPGVTPRAPISAPSTLPAPRPAPTVPPPILRRPDEASSYVPPSPTYNDPTAGGTITTPLPTIDFLPGDGGTAPTPPVDALPRNVGTPTLPTEDVAPKSVGAPSLPASSYNDPTAGGTITTPLAPVAARSDQFTTDELNQLAGVTTGRTMDLRYEGGPERLAAPLGPNDPRMVRGPERQAPALAGLTDPRIQLLSSTDTSLRPNTARPEPILGPGDTYATPTVDPIIAALDSDRPLVALTNLVAETRGPGYDASQDAMHVAGGIGALLRGDLDQDGRAVGAWAEPYLNDVARMAWAKQERQQGRPSDLRDTPIEYVEQWKDAFYGSDRRVPLVKEMNQTLIDAEVDRTPPGKAFDWRNVYGQSGENGLTLPQVTGVDCGPNAFSTILRSRGYNADVRGTFDYAIDRGYHSARKLPNGTYTDGQFSGPDNFVRMLRDEAGMEATSVGINAGSGAGWDQVDKELAEGRPVTLSSVGHYWVISAKNANGQYYAGATALRGQSPWMPRGAFNYSPNPGENGMANTAIFARGDVNPTSRAVTTMRLPPPTGAPRDTRPLLSGQTIREGGPGPAPAATAPSAPTADWVTSPGARKLPEPYRPMVAKAGSDEGVDPDWITAIMMQESGGVPTAQSGAGASGLMQLIPPTARAMGVTDIFDPAQNIRGGARYFKQMLDQFKDPKLALAAYNAGPGAVTRYNGVPPYSETQHYVTRVSQNYANIKAERGDQQRGLAPGTEAESDYAEAPAPDVPAPEEAASPRERLGARLLSDMRRPPEEGTYGGPRELARVAEAAQRENPWNTDPNAQPARHAGMRAFFEMPEPERDQIYTQSLEQALTDEGITDPAERQRWAQNMRLVAKGDARVPGENPSLNPFMMAGEGRGTPLYANSAADKGPHSNELNSSAMGYYQFIIHDPRDPNKDPYGHRAYIPPGGNFFDPVTQQRMFIRAIRGSAKHHGDPASVVREKWSKSDHTWGP